MGSDSREVEDGGQPLRMRTILINKTIPNLMIYFKVSPFYNVDSISKVSLAGKPCPEPFLRTGNYPGFVST